MQQRNVHPFSFQRQGLGVPAASRRIAWLIALLGGLQGVAAAAAPAAPWGAVQVVVAGTASGVQRHEGTVEAERQAVLSVPVQGAITELRVQAGQTVKAGQLLLRVDARAAGQGAQAAAAQAEAARAALKLAQQDLARQHQLHAQGFISGAALDQAQAQAQASQAQARAQLAAAEAAQTQTGLHQLQSPFAGVLAELPVGLGDLAQPGRPLAVVYDPQRLRVSVNLPAGEASTANGKVRLDPSPRAWHIWINGQRIPAARAVPLPALDARTQTQQWRLDLPAGTGALPGQVVRVEWVSGSATPPEDARLHIPRSAVLRRGEQDLVYVLSAREQPLLRAVRLGATHGEQVEVLAGVRAGERLLLEPQRAARLAQGTASTSGGAAR